MNDARRFLLSASLALASTAATMTSASASTTTCSTVSACLFGLNSASGPGVEGSSASGNGLLGLSATNTGIVGRTLVNSTTAGTGKAGISGYDGSTNKTTFNSGVYGYSAYGMGVQGRSLYGPAMMALSYHGNGLTVSSGDVQYTGFTNTGLVAQSAAGTGIVGIGEPSGVTGFSAVCNTPEADWPCASPFAKYVPTGGALNAGTDQGGLGLNIDTDTDPNVELQSLSGVGATINAGSVGMMITPDRTGLGAPALVLNGALGTRGYPTTGFQGAIITGYNGVSITSANIGLAVTSGYILNGTASPVIEAQDSQSADSGTVVLYEGTQKNGDVTSTLDNNGNLTLAGTVVQKGATISRIANVDGTYAAAYNARSTMPTIEDVGESTLTAGTAYVALDQALRRSFDTTRGYLVFLTPQGPTSGLFVTNKTAAGFTVREIGSARDSLAFDYRIVARPYAENGPRLAAVSAAIHSGPRVPLFYHHLKPLRFVHGKLDTSSLPKPSF